MNSPIGITPHVVRECVVCLALAKAMSHVFNTSNFASVRAELAASC